MDRNLFKVLISLAGLMLIAGCIQPSMPPGNPAEVTVTFNAQGGTPAPPSQTLQNGQNAERPSPNPEKTGYEFVEWITADGTAWNFTAPVQQNLTLTARYNVSVTFNPNGGSIASGSAQYYAEMNQPLSCPNLNSPSSGPQNLLGWTTQEPPHSSPQLFDTSAGTDIPLTLYAVWTDSWVVTFNADGGTPTPPNQAVADNGTAAQPSLSPQLSGHHFLYWSTDNGASGYNFSTPVTSSITLTAQWCARLNSATRVTADSIELKTESDNPKYKDSNFTVSYTTSDNPAPQNLSITGSSQSGDSITLFFSPLNLDSFTHYTFEVSNGSETVSITVKNSNWLVLMYLAADNNLNDPLYIDLNEAEHGLSLIRTPEGTPLSGYASVNVVTLWDGWNNAGALYGTPSSRVYELGSDGTINTTLSSETEDLSDNIEWMQDEVNMGDHQTLINFLTWAQNHYKADHIILQFGNHGGGPRSMTKYITLPDGRKIPWNRQSGRRAMCWDEDSQGDYLSTQELSTALNAAGYGSANRLGMLLMDVCLAGAVEEAYQYRNYAQYFAASPNTIPGSGMNYSRLMQAFTTGATPRSIGEILVDNYADYYKLTAAEWQTVINEYTGYGIPAQYVPLYYPYAATLSCIDLTAVESIYTAVDAMASVLTSAAADTRNIEGFYYDTVQKQIVTQPNSNTIPILYRDFIKMAHVSPSSPLNYMGTYTWLFDLGGLATNISTRSAATINGSSNPNSWSELHSAAEDVLSALETAVIRAWRDGSNSDSCLYYCHNTAVNPILQEHYFGLSICGGTVEIGQSGGQLVLQPEKYPDFYGTALDFGSNEWEALLGKWFPSP